MSAVVAEAEKRMQTYLPKIESGRTAFDRALTSVSYKSRVLTLTSVWWFNRTQHIMANHLLGVPHPSAIICKECTVFSVEFVVRGYITDSASTSMWTNCKNDSRDFCGHKLPEDFKQHQKLPENLDFCEKKTLELLAFGQEQTTKRGLILVDSKYEFGLDEGTGEILLIDETHTPDSRRYWLVDSYEQRMAEGSHPRTSTRSSCVCDSRSAATRTTTCFPRLRRSS
ncbi:hypothetical protein PF002_g21882 [Phytophthora fragariae]|uniref:phosphoribosylaminoimidazolesuccinocarboxamide synthase n=1 Tax=Phytophthora fragariae TaxID=53985 RepID=A0A6A4CBK2_9STRA|nr:hypothetical protein PF002_g21882 [Phytophthora fragariae]KAE9288513.1 hypothetical protein PF001_g20477 [Phytophthora fragariae]